MTTLEKHYKVTAKQEYEKNPKLSAADVQELLQWSDENLQLHGKLFDLQVIMFLHACDFDKEYAKKVLKQCYHLRSKKCAAFFSARDPAHPFNQKQLDVINFNINTDNETGFSYIWSNLNSFDSSEYYPTIGTKIMFMAIDLDQTENGTKSGYQLILDANNFTLSHALRYNLSHAKQIMTYVQEGTCFKIEKIYLFNVNSAVDRILSMLKQFMSTELINKITIKSSSKSAEFLKTLPPKVVPKDYEGGLAPRLKDASEVLRKKLLESRDYFLDEERLRNGVVKNENIETLPDDENNEDSSFKNLCID